MNLKDVECYAARYAENVAKETITKQLAEAYVEGYRHAYNACHCEDPVYIDKTEFIDLGLPSGTLWSSDYEKEEDESDFLYLPYCKAKEYTLPTEEQINELFICCKRFNHFENNNLQYSDFVGPNGNMIRIYTAGLIQSTEKLYLSQSYFWVDTIGCDSEKKVAVIFDSDFNSVSTQFSGFHIPVRRVTMHK